MINAVVAGNLGKDSELRQAGGAMVCSFSVASSSKVKGAEVTTWVRCSLFGKRGEALAEYLTKGKSVCVSGGLTAREYEGKTYLELRVDDVKLMGGGKEANGSGGSPRGGSARDKGSSSGKTIGGESYSDADYSDDEIPF